MKNRSRIVRVLALSVVFNLVNARAAEVVWTNLAGGNWNAKANWLPNQVPGVFDHAWITNNGAYAVRVTNDVSAGSLTLGSASGAVSLGGAGMLILAGPLVWQGGAISNTVVCLNGGQIGGSASKYLAGGRLFNSGPLTLGALLYTGNGSVISNLAGGTFDFTADYGTSFTGGLRGVIYNAGLLRKTGGTGTARVDDLFTNAGTLETRSGTLRLTATNCVQTAGGTRLLGGGLQVDTGYTVRGGMLSGSNTLTGNLVNEGIVSPSESTWTNPGPATAQLTINGDFTETSGGALVVQLGGATPGTEHDLLAVSGIATLGGTLDVCLSDGYSPPPSSIYIFLSAASVADCFAALNYPPGNAWVWQVAGSVSILSTTTNTAPVPAAVLDQTISALRPFDLTLTATDAEAPPQTLAWAANSVPTNLTISPAGQLHWTPTAAQVGTNRIVAAVWDNGGGNCPDGQGPCSLPPHACASGLGTLLTFNLMVVPPLSIEPAGANTLLLTWPAPATGWRLQTATNLLSGWAELPPPYGANGDTLTWTVTNLVTAPARFYRLFQ